MIDRVFVRHGSYHLDMGRDESGRRQSKVLCRLDDGEATLYTALAKYTSPRAQTIAQLLDAFLAHGMDELAFRTREDYRGYVNRQLKKKFGHMLPDELESTEVAQYLERRKKAGAKSSANKEIACLASAFQYGLRHGLCTRDPTRGVKRNRTKPRDRYARHDEFLKHFEAAPEWLQDVMAASYLMELRPGEVIALTRTAVTPKGIVIEESKTGKIKVVEWSKGLQYFVTRSLSRNPTCPRVFTNSRGDPVTKWAMHSAWRRLRKGLGLTAAESFTFHDLRAKGESDNQSGGHELLTLYRRARTFKPVA